MQNRQQIIQERAPEYYYQEQSRNIAGAMLEVALGNINVVDNYLSSDPASEISGKTIDMMGGKGTIVKAKPVDGYLKTRYEVEITGEIETFDGSTSVTTIDATFNRRAFSIYAYFTNVEPEIWFVTGDVLNGPVHTNGKFHIDGDPVFNGPITSHKGLKKRRGSDPEYNDGADFDAKKVPLPKDAPEVVKLAKKEKGGIGQFDKDIFVEFKDDDSDNNTGTVEISEAKVQCVVEYTNGDCYRYDYAPDANTLQTYNLSDFNGVISSKKKVYTKGKVDGQVTVHSEKDVEIMSDLYYANRKYKENGNSDPISDDRMGIISEGNTIVDNNAHGHFKNSKDLNIDASILSLGDSFKVQGHDDGDSRGTLNILGGLIQRKRGAVGMVSGSGYLKNYNYDTRFAKNSTPGFPRKKRFEIESWSESTTIEPNEN